MKRFIPEAPPIVGDPKRQRDSRSPEIGPILARFYISELGQRCFTDPKAKLRYVALPFVWALWPRSFDTEGLAHLWVAVQRIGVDLD